MLLPGNWLCFCFGAIGLVAGLMISLAIGDAMSMALKVAVGLLR